MPRIQRSFTFSIILLLALVSAGSHSIYSFNGDFCKIRVDQVYQSECCCNPVSSTKSNCCEESKEKSELPSSNYQYGQQKSACNCHIAPVSSVPVNSTESTITLVQKHSYQKLCFISNFEAKRLQSQSNKILKSYVSSNPSSLSILPVGNVRLRI